MRAKSNVCITNLMYRYGCDDPIPLAHNVISFNGKVRLENCSFVYRFNFILSMPIVAFPFLSSLIRFKSYYYLIRNSRRKYRNVRFICQTYYKSQQFMNFMFVQRRKAQIAGNKLQ